MILSYLNLIFHRRLC